MHEPAKTDVAPRRYEHFADVLKVMLHETIRNDDF